MNDRLSIYDSLLDEIESYQVETDQLVSNIRYIDGLLARSERQLASYSDLNTVISSEACNDKENINTTMIFGLTESNAQYA